MSEEFEQQLTIPNEPSSAPDHSKQVLARLHEDDHRVLRVMLKRDKLSFQKFVALCVRGYLDADPYMLQFLRIARELDAIPEGVRDKYALSMRERNQLFEEIEQAQKEGK